VAAPPYRNGGSGVSRATLVRSMVALAVAGAAPPACDLSTPPVAVQLAEGVADTTFALAVGQEARLGILRLAFTGVTEDSRCPSDVVCVWAGNAAVEIGVSFGMGPTIRYVLNTTVDPKSVDVGGYRITLVALQPYPVSTGPIPPASYLATFRLQRLVYPPD
jgi:hypothetical protein